MCGIAGIIGSKNLGRAQRDIVLMADKIAHRGPDGEGFLMTNSAEYIARLKAERPRMLSIALEHRDNVVLAHRRLSILDLSANAAQPMTDASGRFAIVFNGEIYNHSSLRSELESRGRIFLTDHSDTEVILNAYAEWGSACLERFNGMWALCIWDKIEGTFFLARDRAGKKPLYYSLIGGQLFFASELKCLLEIPEISKELEPKSIYDFLSFQMVPAPRTIFKDVFKLPAAHFIKYKIGENVFLQKYWHSIQSEPYLKDDENTIATTLREKIFEAARIRMLADVEVGVLLSGGVDSSVNLACLSKYSERPIKAYSVGFENQGSYSNEFYYARKAAEHLSADYNELTLTKEDFFSFLPKMVHSQDEPIADPANIPIYYISKIAAAQGVKVLLGGEGSDELFVGYEHWRISKEFESMFQGREKLAKLAAYIHSQGPLKNRRAFYHTLYEKVILGQPVFWSGTELYTESNKRKILSAEFLEKVNIYSSYDSVKHLYDSLLQKKEYDAYDWMAVSDLQFRLPDLLLARLDRMMMAASVEGRNPFLDINVIEYALRIPPNLRTKGKEAKYILKKAFEGYLPNEILYRKKDSFSVPLKQLFNTEPYRSQCLTEIKAFNEREQIFNKEYIRHLGAGASGVEFWNITNLAMWHNQLF